MWVRGGGIFCADGSAARRSREKESRPFVWVGFFCWRGSGSQRNSVGRKNRVGERWIIVCVWGVLSFPVGRFGAPPDEGAPQVCAMTRLKSFRRQRAARFRHASKFLVCLIQAGRNGIWMLIARCGSGYHVWLPRLASGHHVCVSNRCHAFSNTTCFNVSLCDDSDFRRCSLDVVAARTSGEQCPSSVSA